MPTQIPQLTTGEDMVVKEILNRINILNENKSVNKQNLCGSKTWRLPTKSEMESLVFCSDNKNQTLSKEKFGANCTGSPIIPTINTTYFPNTPSVWFWSSSPGAGFSSNAWGVYFYYGYSYGYYKSSYGNVRLVR